MVAVRATAAEIVPLLGERVGIAAVNGPDSVVISGALDAVSQIAARFDSRGRRTSRLTVSHAFHLPLVEPVLAEFQSIAESLSYAPPQIPVVSTVTGELASTGELTDPGYWVRQVRETVRFADAVRCLHGSGVTRFLELGPDAVLSAMGRDSIGEDCVAAAGELAFVPALRRDRDEERELVSAVAQLHAQGVAVDWPAFFAGCGARRVDLPTYPFQRRRHWVPAATAAGDVSGIGQVATGHRLLGAVVTLPDTDGIVVTGRLSVRETPWLADHDLLGTVVFPGTGLAELALQAGAALGCDVLAELTAQAPLVLPDHGALMLRIVVGVVDETGARPVSIHTRGENGEGDWTRHASGILTTDDPAPGREMTGPEVTGWPPPGATPVHTADTYQRLLGRGYGYGPAFQLLKAAWRRGDELYVEVALREEETGGFGLHPALLDAALQPDRLGDGYPGQAGQPSVWRGVRLHAPGASALRVRLAPAEPGGTALTATDPAGRPVLSVQSLVSRPVSADQLAAAGGAHQEPLLRMDWVSVPTSGGSGGGWAVLGGDRLGLGGGAPVYPDVAALLAAVESGSPVPELVLYAPRSAPGDVPSGVRTVTEDVLGVVRSWLADERLGRSRLAVLTRGAVAAAGTDPDLSQAPLWGLVRAAQSEQPGRLVLVDTDGTEESRWALPAAASSAEPELAVRGGEPMVPRLVPGPATTGRPAPWDRTGTVLITGGTAGPGALLARHLVAEHGVRHLLLTASGAGGLVEAGPLRAELAGLGAQATVLACDTADPAALTGLLDGIGADHPLTAVVHAEAVTDNALIDAMTPKRLDAVLRAKVDTAWQLHELTRDRDLAGFVLLSSTSGLLFGTGQANDAAASVFLDALAVHRRARGLPATSLVYGPWQVTGSGGEADDGYLRRMRRLGLPALPSADGLALFDRALGADEPVLVAVRLDKAALRARPA